MSRIYFVLLYFSFSIYHLVCHCLHAGFKSFIRLNYFHLVNFSCHDANYTNQKVFVKLFLLKKKKLVCKLIKVHSCYVNEVYWGWNMSAVLTLPANKYWVFLPLKYENLSFFLFFVNWFLIFMNYLFFKSCYQILLDLDFLFL